MPDKVVDASVLGAMIFEEDRADEAEALLKGFELHAPRLLAYEITHVAQKKCLRYPDHKERFEKGLETAWRIEILWREVDHHAVLRLALNTGLSTYDASYLYLARILGTELATFDERLSKLV